MREIRKPDYSLYLVTDRMLSLGRPLEEVVSAAVRGGVTCVQLREKDCPAGEFIGLAQKIKPILQDFNVPLIINDRLDVALAIGAEGVHLGQDDIPLSMARQIAGERLIIGISAGSVEEAEEAEKGGADYLGISPVFSTPTKTDTGKPQGLEGVSRIRQAVEIPIVGIGGLNLSNAAEVISRGADGIAVVSAIVSAADPEEASRRLLHEIRRAG